jgi:hypothetical protein
VTIKPVYSTMGQSSPATVKEDAGTGYYKYRGDKRWPENSKEYQNPPLQPPSDGALAGAQERARQNSAGKAGRIAEFAGYLADGCTVERAAELVGVTLKTARGYEQELKERQQGGGA